MDNIEPSAEFNEDIDNVTDTLINIGRTCMCKFYS